MTTAPMASVLPHKITGCGAVMAGNVRCARRAYMVNCVIVGRSACSMLCLDQLLKAVATRLVEAG
jgi:hypothetical protein